MAGEQVKPCRIRRLGL